MFPDPLPEKVRSDRSRRAEVQVYDQLAQSLPADVRVFHSVAWLARDNSGTAADGEADFVIVDPRWGLLVIEVKGGGIEYDGHTGQWWSIDATGTAHGISDPFAQATRSKHALLGKIRELPAFRDTWVGISHAVVFPDLGRAGASFGPSAPPAIVIVGDDLAHLGERIQQVCEWGGGAAPLSAVHCAELERLLAPRTRVRAPAAVAARGADAEIISLTEEQFEVLDLLSRMRWVAVSGSAGSGKSLLAAEQARRFAAQGFRTLLVCYNQPLAMQLAASLAGEPLLEVHTFHDFCRSMAVRAGLLPAEFVDEAPGEFFLRLPALLLEALESRADLRFDAIVVDEGQDFEPDWWDLLQLGLADPEHGVFFVFHDDNQHVRDNHSALPADLAPIHLNKNLRNTRSIHAFAQQFSDDQGVQAVGPQGRPVEFAEIVEGEAVTRTLSRVIDRLVREESFRPEEITILSGRGRTNTALAGVERLGAYRCGTPPTLPGVVGADTIRRFKGLDSRVVILCELEGLVDAPALLYVGATRARAHLVVVGTGETLTRFRA